MNISPAPVAQQKEFGGITQEQIAQTFQGYDSCFVMLDTKNGQAMRFNDKGCSEQMSPCSTFKIFSSLVGLESGVLHNENHGMQWDGTEFSIKSWNRDHTLQSAMTNSVVWYFRRLASSVGEPRMKTYIHKVRYGNEDISGGITQFWLKSSLKISPDEQVQFLKKLINDELSFSKRSMAIVRGLIRLDQTPKGTLYGKTGSWLEDGREVFGWFVGYVVQPDNTYIFATNIKAADGAWGKKARELTEKLFTKAGLL
jgi:bla regulator protein BlaR1